MRLWADRLSGFEIDTVFIGGGTPSLLTEGETGILMESIEKYFSPVHGAEITIECNPGTLTEGRLRLFRREGINRLSLGLQSASDQELARLGRIHRYRDFEQCYTLALEAGFDNINVDIMSAIPGQTLDSCEETLQKVLARKPRHISSYSLIIEEGTPFYEKYAHEPPVDEETDRLMYERTGELLSAAGYRRYEISNYALPGGECRHNLKYWRRQPYLGVGLGASSFLRGERFSNEREMERYREKIFLGEPPVAETEKITEKMARQEFMYLGLRCMEGVSCREFQREFGMSLERCFGGALDANIQRGLLRREGDRVSLTPRGIDVSNRVFADFIT